MWNYFVHRVRLWIVLMHLTVYFPWFVRIVKVTFKTRNEESSATRNMELRKFQPYKRDVKKYWMEQEEENTRFIRKTSRKDKIKRGNFLKVFVFLKMTKD